MIVFNSFSVGILSIQLTYNMYILGNGWQHSLVVKKPLCKKSRTWVRTSPQKHSPDYLDIHVAT